MLRRPRMNSTRAMIARMMRIVQSIGYERSLPRASSVRPCPEVSARRAGRAAIGASSTWSMSSAGVSVETSTCFLVVAAERLAG
jgi:hypothetical protein